MRNYIKGREAEKRGSHFVWVHEIDIYNSQTLPDNVSIEEVLGEVDERIPHFMLKGIESIFFGDIEALKKQLQSEASMRTSGKGPPVLPTSTTFIHKTRWPACYPVRPTFLSRIGTDTSAPGIEWMSPPIPITRLR